MDQRMLQPNHDILNLSGVNRETIIRIDPDGKIYWRGREVTTDNDFRSAMLDLAKALGRK